MDLFAQIMGFMGAAFLMLSFQSKKSLNFFILQTLGSGFFLLNYYLLGAYAGVLISILSVSRTIIISKFDGKIRKIGVYITIFLMILCSFFIGIKLTTILMLISYVSFTLAMNTKNSKCIRLTQLVIASPLQLIHNALVFSAGGVICEIFNIISIILSFFRFGLNDFDKRRKSQ